MTHLLSRKFRLTLIKKVHAVLARRPAKSGFCSHLLESALKVNPSETGRCYLPMESAPPASLLLVAYLSVKMLLTALFDDLIWYLLLVLPS